MKYQSKSKIKVLLIDDEPDLISVMKRGLESLGFEVDAFTNSSAALKHFKANYYERIISNVHMPSMNGFELARRIWEIDSKADICFLSSFEIRENEARKVLQNLKNHCFVTKPLTPSQLAKHIEEHLVRL